MAKKIKQEVKQEQVQPRDIKLIEQEYNQLCMQGGNLQYQIACLSEDLANVNARQKAVNQEGFAVKQAQKAIANAALDEIASITPSENN